MGEIVGITPEKARDLLSSMKDMTDRLVRLRSFLSESNALAGNELAAGAERGPDIVRRYLEFLDSESRTLEWRIQIITAAGEPGPNGQVTVEIPFSNERQAKNQGRADGREAAELWDELDGDVHEWLDRVKELVAQGNLDPAYTSEFLRSLGVDNLMSVADEVIGEHLDTVLFNPSEEDMEKVREDLGPLATMLGVALRDGTLSEDFRDQLLDEDHVEELSLLMEVAPETFPPEFMAEAAERIFDYPGSWPGPDRKAAMFRAMRALTANPAAAERFFAQADTGLINKFIMEAKTEVIDGENNARQLGALMEAALSHDPGSRLHQQAMTNLIGIVNNDPGGFDQGHMADVRAALVEGLEPYLPYLSHLGQQSSDYTPDSGDSSLPEPWLGVSREDAISFVGVLMGEEDSREAFNEMISGYFAEQNVAAEFADIAAAGGDTDAFFEELEEGLDAADEVGGLASIAVLGQNAADLSEEERIEASLGLFDTITTGLGIGLSEGAGALGGPPAAVGTGVVTEAIFDAGRDALEDSLNQDADDTSVATEVDTVLAAMTENLDEQLREAGIENPDHRATMQRLIEDVLSGQLTPALTDIIDARL